MNQKLLSFLGSLLIRILGKTVRIREVNSEVCKKYPNVVFSFWHGEQFLLCYHHRNQNVLIMTSLSKDGEIQTGIMNRLGYITVRGSSSRGGEKALVEAIRYVRKGNSAAFAVDGPKGPIYEVKPGIIYLALKSGTPLVPAASCSKTVFVFNKAWDKYELPLPFSKAAIVYGKPISINDGDDIEQKRMEVENRLKEISNFAHKQFWDKDVKKYLESHPFPKILIVQPSRIGDVVFSLPVLAALRTKYPKAWIGWVVDERCAPVVEGNPDLDEVIIFNRRQASFSYIKEFKKRLRMKNIDLSIDLHGLFKSAFIVKLAGAKFKLGSASTYGMKELAWLFSDEIKPENKDMHCVQRHLAVARFLGCSDEKPVYRFGKDDTLAESVKQKLVKYGIDVAKPIVAVHPGGGWKSRRWFPERFAELCDKVNLELGVQTVLVGGKEGGSSEKGLNETIKSLSKTNVFDLTGLLTLKELIAFFRFCKVFVGNEAGPMHIAMASGIPVVAIIGPTNVKRTGPYGDNAYIVRHEVGCQPCRERNCAKMVCMKQIKIEDVFEQVKSINKCS